MTTIEDVWKSNAGAHLFNGISRMNLVDRDDNLILFSKRMQLTKQVIGLMLEAGYMPQEIHNG